jgi:hypothetical protein
MSKDYTIFINKRPIKVTLQMLMCHCTGNIKGLLPKDEYSIFLRDTLVPPDTLVSVIETFLSYTEEEEYVYVSKNNIVYSYLIPYLRKSLLLSCWYGSNLRHIKRVISINELVTAGVNYSRLQFSEAYLSLQPLTRFYKKLTIDYDIERYMPLYEKDYVTINNIEDVLKSLDTDVSYLDIKEDIEKHCILNPYKDYYIWGSKPLYEWFLNVDYIDYNIINLNKLLSMKN